MSQSQTLRPPSNAPAAAEQCECEHPIRAQRAERKGAAATVCLRCGLPVPLRLR